MIRKLFAAALLLCLCCFALPQTASAAASTDIINGGDCGDALTQQSAVCKSKTDKDPIAGEDGVLLKISRIVAFAAGVAAVIVLIVGAIKFITSAGDANNAANARGTIVNALIGLVVIVLAQVFIEFVISKL